jgi:uncharacterized protein (TIGR02246 family)
MTTDADKAAIAALTQRMVAGWAYGEAETIADLFVEDGTMILPGVFCAGRDEVRAYFAAAFEGRYKGTQVTGKPISIRSLGPDAAILLSQGGVLAAGETEPTGESAWRPTRTPRATTRSRPAAAPSAPPDPAVPPYEQGT